MSEKKDPRELALRLARIVDGIYVLAEDSTGTTNMGMRMLASEAHYAAHELMEAMPRDKEDLMGDVTDELVPDPPPRKPKKRASK